MRKSTQSRRRPRRLLGAAATVTAFGLVTATAAPASAAQGPLEALVRAENILAHMQNLQTIADFNGGNRAHGTDGYAISASYVTDQLKQAGYTPWEHEYDFELWRQTSEPTLAQVEPDPRDFTFGPEEDFLTLVWSAPGDVTAPGVGVNTDSPESGCAAEDFADFPEGSIAIVRRGTCTFAQKTQNAADAGAAAIVVFNHGETDQSLGPIAGTLSESSEIPALGASLAVGEDLLAAADDGELVLRLAVSSETVADTGYNVIAETEGGAADNVVVIGAHLDSVEEGPGINDNGSGVAAILEVAKQLARLDAPNNKVRFAFWGTEELGLIGSTEYVRSLSEEEIDDIALYLNFDMVASPNYARLIYDGRGELEGSVVDPPTGSAAIQRMFENYFADRGLVAEPTEFSGRSDYVEFVQEGIPAGGLFSGGDGVKTEEQVGYYGGTAGEQFDPNYHTAADDIDNINEDSLRELSGGIAHAVETYAQSTLPVNGLVRTLHFSEPQFARNGELWLR